MPRFLSLSVSVFFVLVLIGAGCSQSGSTGVSGEGDVWTGSLADALRLNKTMKCTWSSEDGDGVSYIKGEKVRTEATVNGTTSYIIGDGECSYMWEGGSTEGFEFCIEVDAEAEAEAGGEFDDSGDMGDFGEQPDVDVNCSYTSVNDGLFTPPADVSFSNPFEGFGF